MCIVPCEVSPIVCLSVNVHLTQPLIKATDEIYGESLASTVFSCEFNKIHVFMYSSLYFCVCTCTCIHVCMCTTIWSSDCLRLCVKLGAANPPLLDKTACHIEQEVMLEAPVQPGKRERNELQLHCANRLDMARR